MPLDPLEGHIQPLNQLQQFAPQVGIDGRLFIGFQPALLPPACGPTFGDTVDDIARIAVDGYRRVPVFQFAQGHNTGHEFHPVIGGQAVAAGEFPALAVVNLNDPIAARPRIVDASAVGVNSDLIGAWRIFLKPLH